MTYLSFFVAGIAIGTLFFATLVWQIRLLVEKKRMIAFLIIAFVRFGFLAGLFYLLLVCGNWQGELLALAGVITARFLCKAQRVRS